MLSILKKDHRLKSQLRRRRELVLSLATLQSNQERPTWALEEELVVVFKSRAHKKIKTEQSTYEQYLTTAPFCSQALARVATWQTSV